MTRVAKTTGMYWYNNMMMKMFVHLRYSMWMAFQALVMFKTMISSLWMIELPLSMPHAIAVSHPPFSSSVHGHQQGGRACKVDICKSTRHIIVVFIIIVR